MELLDSMLINKKSKINYSYVVLVIITIASVCYPVYNRLLILPLHYRIVFTALIVAGFFISMILLMAFYDYVEYKAKRAIKYKKIKSIRKSR